MYNMTSCCTDMFKCRNRPNNRVGHKVGYMLQSKTIFGLEMSKVQIAELNDGIVKILQHVSKSLFFVI